MIQQAHLQKDITSKRLEEYPDVFADILNVLAFQGKTALLPEYLEEKSGSAFYRDTASAWHENRRDVIKADKRSGVLLSVLSLENQTTQDKDMVFRVMGYDFAGYQKQIASGQGRRSPVATWVIYFGPGPWEQPKQLLEALDLEDVPYRDDLIRAVSNPHINVVEISRLPAETRQQFQSDFRFVAEWFRADREGLEADLQNQPQKIRHAEALLDFLSAFSGEQRALDPEVRRKIQKQEQEEEGGLTMKSFLTELLDREGQKGKQLGLAEGEQLGLLKGQRQIVAFMLQSEKDLGKIAALTGLPEEQIRKLSEMGPLD